jgi:autotransporter translocation and assembly factor TamB
VKKFLRITYYAGITFVFILVGLVGYTQTRGFRSTLLGYIHSHYHSALNGTLNIGRLEGNLITGIRLYDISVSNADTSLFTADRIELTHDPLALFFKRVSLGRVSVINAQIHLVRSAGGTWNFAELFVSASHDTATSPWVISIKDLELVNARVLMVDSVIIDERARGLRDVPPTRVVDYAQIALDSLNIEGGLRVVPSETDLQLRMMSFTLETPRIHLRHLRGDFKLADNEASVSNLSLATERSQLDLSASLSKINIAGIRDVAELKRTPVNLDLDAKKIDTRELKQFLYPWVDFLDGKAALHVQADGEFGRLNVHKVEVETEESSVDIAGRILNLDHPRDLELDLSSSNSVVDPGDVSAHLPGLFLPDMEALGRTRFRLTFKGPPTDFAATVHAVTDAGTADVSGQLKISDVLVYKTEFATGNLDLGTLFGDDQLKSNLNANGTLSGIGTDLHTTTAVARVEVDSS